MYDVLDDNRTDLDLYLRLAREYAALHVLDVGCGTGELALRLADLGMTVTGLDPARASLEVARGKPGAHRITWVHGVATDAPVGSAYDLAVMTGNVAQAILGDAWPATLTAVHDRLRPGGRLAFESRVPDRRAWAAWTPDRTRRSTEVPGTGAVETWAELLQLTGPPTGPLVTFRWSFRFPDGEVVTSDSTLAFRDLDGLTDDVVRAGLEVEDVRDAPDRPGLEHVVVARRP